MTITITGNRVVGIPADARVIVHGARAAPVGGVLHLSVDYDEAVDVRIYDGSDEGVMLTVPCTPAGNPGGNGAAAHVVEQDHARLRIAADGYPPIAEQLDSLWKGGAEEAAMRARIAAVKTRFPKKGTPK